MKFEPDEVDSPKYLKKLFQQSPLCLLDDETCMLLQTCKYPSSGSTGEQFKKSITALVLSKKNWQWLLHLIIQRNEKKI